MAEKSPKLTPIRPSKFYERDSDIKKRIAALEEKYQKKRLLYREASRMQPTLFGPTTFWETFYKQADALECALENSTKDEPLCVFVYEDFNNNGRRMFVVAHPEIYWYKFMRQEPEARCTYEVIPEGKPCWLYLDLEFPTSLNPDSNGSSMTKTLIVIFCAFFKKYWGCECTEENVLNLDSTTKQKFSRHLIFCTKDVAFKHNAHAGRFVKSVIAEISQYLSYNSTSYHDVLSYFPRNELEQLFIDTEKKRKSFVDITVYSRNRHFRIYKATKWSKLAHLELAAECNYVPTVDHKDRDLNIFLDSLVSWFPGKNSFMLLEFNEDTSVEMKKFPSGLSQDRRFLTQHPNSGTSTKFPFIDKFILDLIHPGGIRTCTYFEASRKIVYDIVNNRYCANIKRAHKSNNPYYIVDLIQKCFYQKCHDEEDCFGFRSDPIPLPVEIAFLLEEEDDDLFLSLPDGDDSLTQLNPDTSI